ncbi:MAG: amidohydrolase [Opitutales bacterium]|nr:amidohydrolase [Opitutales bacterium]
MRTNEEIGVLVEGVLPEVEAFRRDLHAHPELGFEERRTAARVLAELGKLSAFEVQSEVGGTTGVVATIGKNLPGPCLALRADMDALPLTELGMVPHASKTPGKMHACGHDGHTAILVGVARVLQEIRGELEGPVKVIFQPAEEGGGGGRVLRDAGVLREPIVDAVFGLHNMPVPELPEGTLGFRSGPLMAGTASFYVKLRGRGGHAAAPHQCIDPIVVGSEVVQGLQTIVSRSHDPVKALVISVTRFNSGTAQNIIPEEAELSGTIRALEPSVLDFALKAVDKRVQGIASAHGVEAEVRFVRGYPPLLNNETATGLLHRVAAEIGWTERVREVSPVMGGEDFAYYLEDVPGAFWFLGAHPGGSEPVPFCHNPAFDFNDRILFPGITFHVELARRFARLWPQVAVG